MSRPTNYCTIYLVRHGETEWNVQGIVQGRLDSPLTEAGIKQVQGLAQELREIRFDAIFSSDALRAQRTAEIIKLERDVAVQTSELLRERNFGKYEGKPSADFKAAVQHLYEQQQALAEEEKSKFKFGDDIESDEEIMSRFITQLREISVAYPGKTVLVVTHGGTIRTFLIRVGYGTYESLPSGSFKNAGYVKLESDGVDFFIKDVKGIKIG